MGDRTGLTKLDRTNGYDDGRDYMRVKKSKLAQQNDQIREALRSRNSSSKTDLFKGISISVNGRTQPTADELKRLILLNGGDYHPYYRYQTTKFMIATNLSSARIKTLRPDDRIVKPEWITESVQAKCLLPYEDYQLFEDEPRGKNGSSKSTAVVVKKASHLTTMTDFIIKGAKNNRFSQTKEVEPTSSSMSTCVPLDQEASNGETSKSSVEVTKKIGRPTTMADFVIRGAKNNRFPEPKVAEITTTRANICGLTNLDDVIALMNEWVGCPEGIRDEDTACVTKYFYDLMDEKDYHNKFYEVIDAFQQRVTQYDDKRWIQLYNNLVTTLKGELNQGIEASQNLYQLITLIETEEDSGSRNYPSEPEISSGSSSSLLRISELDVD